MTAFRIFIWCLLIGAHSLHVAAADTPASVHAVNEQVAATSYTSATADHIERVQLYVRDQQLYLNADIQFELSPALYQAALKGMPLHFTADVEIKKQRWWWFDKTEIKKSRTWRVVYNALTRQWRVGSGDLLRPEASLDEALYPMRQLRHWALSPLDQLDPQEHYQGRLRLRLDTSLLTRPLQVDALNGQSWSLTTPWKDFSFSVDALQP